MKKRTILIPILVVVVLVGIVFAGRYYYSGLGVRHYDDGTLGVADLARWEFDQNNFSFFCDAAFKTETDDSGQEKILDIITQDIRHYNGPNEYTFIPQGETEALCIEEGTCYVIQQPFQIDMQGFSLPDIVVRAQFTYDPAVGDFTVDKEVSVV